MNTKILFVDDEELILKGLRRMLAPKRKEWDMFFVSSGEGALALLQEKKLDIVVTDLLMPGMDGHQLLKQVQKQFPGIKRIVLTGQPDRELKTEVVFPAHQYLMKPCSFQTMVTLLEKIMLVDEIKLDAGLKDIISQIETLPSIPEVFQKVQEELEAEEPNIETISSLIAKDVALSSKLISLVNSPYYGQNKITHPKQAVLYLGLNMLKALVITVQAFSVYDPKNVPGLSINMLWEHSKRVACLSKQIAQSEGRSEEEINNAFLAGLLHDVGKLVLAAHFPEKYLRVLSYVGKGEKFVCEVEEDEFGTSHAKVGAYLMGLWGIAPSVNKAISFHNSLSYLSEKSSPLFELTLGNISDHVHKILNPEYVLHKKYVEKLQEFGVEDKIKSWQEQADEHLKEFNSC